MNSIEEVKVPAAGESVSEAVISKIYVKVGDFVKKDQDLFDCDTEKTTLNVSAHIAGLITEILFKEGDTVDVGTVICRIDGSIKQSENSKPALENSKPAVIEAAKQIAPQTLENQKTTTDNIKSSPAATHEAVIKNLDLSKASGTGLNGMITKPDVSGLTINNKKQENISNVAQSAVRSANFIEQSSTVKMSMLRKTVARRLKEAQNTAAILTTFNEVDMSAVMNMRKKHQDDFQKKHGVKLGFMSFFIKASTLALQEIPSVNAQIEGENIIYKNYCHVSVAIGTEKGLVVPVIRHCEKLSFDEIEKEILNYGSKATKGQLTPNDFAGGTFTISNGGTYGSMMSTPIINPPQSAILGMHSITERAVVIDGQIVIRPMMYLALSYDHRIIDGKEAVTFLVKIKNYIENPQRMLLSC